jgi:hypothetical protein
VGVLQGKKCLFAEGEGDHHFSPRFLARLALQQAQATAKVPTKRQAKAATVL